MKLPGHHLWVHVDADAEGAVYCDATHQWHTPDPDSERDYGFLYLSYEPSFWWSVERMQHSSRVRACCTLAAVESRALSLRAARPRLLRARLGISPATKCDVRRASSAARWEAKELLKKVLLQWRSACGGWVDIIAVLA